MKKQLLSIALLPLICLPGLFAILNLKFFDGPGMGDKYGPIDLFAYGVLNALCSFGTALGIAQMLSLTGRAKMGVLIVLAVILFCLSAVATIVCIGFLFLPNC